MMKIAWYWRMAFFRALLYASMVGGGSFMTLSETWSDSTWRDMGTFLRWRFFISIGLSASGVVLAFLDTTMATLRGKEVPAPGAIPPIKTEPEPVKAALVSLLIAALLLGSGCAAYKSLIGHPLHVLHQMHEDKANK